jgi:hypothetical protein
MENGWTEERRARQAAAIRRWRPWERSTGPRTAAGKARAARNADRGGLWRKERARRVWLHQWLRAEREALRRMMRDSDG